MDPDGAFQKEFTEQLESAAVHVKTIPAEAHWRIGAIERRNALLRTVVERLVDENAVTSGEALDWVITAATQTLNAWYHLPQGATSSAIRRRSRSPRSQPSQQHSLAGRPLDQQQMGALSQPEGSIPTAMTDDGHSSIPDAGDMQVTTPDGMSNGTPQTISSGNTTPLLQQAPATPEHAALAAQHKQQARSHKHDKHRRMTKHNRPWTTLITTWDETTFTDDELPPERWDGTRLAPHRAGSELWPRP